MATTYTAEGKVIDWTNGTGSAVSSGDLVQVGQYSMGVASVDIANGSTGSVTIYGVHTLAKNTSDALAAGDPVYWDGSASECINAYVANSYFIGFATEAATASATTCEVAMQPFGAEGAGRRLAVTAATDLESQDFLNGSGEVYLDVANTGAIAVTLPTVADIPVGSKLVVKKTTADAVAVTLDPDGSEQIAGGATFATIDANNDRAVFYSDGSEWILWESTIA